LKAETIPIFSISAVTCKAKTHREAPFAKSVHNNGHSMQNATVQSPG
jgi:hypothetical protein